MLLLFSCGSDNSNKSETNNKKERKELTEGQANLIQKMQVQGLLNIQPEYKRAEIDPTLWNNMTYNVKSNFADGLAIYCGNNDSTYIYWCEIFDMYSGKKIAKSGVWGFKTFN